jgi:hypothetical protein
MGGVVSTTLFALLLGMGGVVSTSLFAPLLRVGSVVSTLLFALLFAASFDGTVSMNLPTCRTEFSNITGARVGDE